MKRIFSLILCLLLVFCLAGCQKKESVQFYYLRSEVQYGLADGVIASESREISLEGTSLEYLLKLYLEGPVSQELRSPFPAGTALVSLSRNDTQLTVTLSEVFSRLENVNYTVACACVASTGFSLTDAESVTILSGDTVITLTRNNVSFWDESGETFPE